jgi:hypothetical protein
MNIALLFDSTLPEYAGFYKWPVNNKVFSTGIIQASGRHMKIWIGDVPSYSHELCERIYLAHTWDRLHEPRPRALLRNTRSTTDERLVRPSLKTAFGHSSRTMQLQMARYCVALGVRPISQ